MRAPDETQKVECRGFLRPPGVEYRRMLAERERLLVEAGDIRCTAAPTCPFFHRPGERLLPMRSLAPWDPSSNATPEKTGCCSSTDDQPETAR